MQRLLIALLVATSGLTPAAAEQIKATLFKRHTAAAVMVTPTICARTATM